MQPILNYIKHPESLLDSLVKNFGQWLPDSTYIKLRYRCQMGKRLNLRKPQTFSEKLQWLKLFDQKPVYTKMVDKILAKEYVASKIGAEYVIPLLGVWKRPEDIEWDSLPDSFVLKTNSGGGNAGVIICKEKSKIDRQSVINNLKYALKQNIFRTRREWPYKNVKPQILAEQYITPEIDTNDLHDYKFFCFNGIVKCFKIDFNRHIHHANYYDCEGNILPFGEKDFLPQPEKKIELPKNLRRMIEFAEVLANGCHFLRVDFYETNEQMNFGEMTFYPASGMGKFEPEEWDYKLGEWLKLPEQK